MPAGCLWPGSTSLPCLGRQQLLEAPASADEILRQRVVREESRDLVLSRVDLDPAALLYRATALYAERRRRRKFLRVADLFQ